VNTDAARIDKLPEAMFGRNEAVGIEYNHQRIRRYVYGRNVQCRSVDVPGVNVFWLTDCAEREARSWFLEGNDQEPVEKKDVELPQRKRKYSPWDVFRGEETVMKSNLDQ